MNAEMTVGKDLLQNRDTRIRELDAIDSDLVRLRSGPNIGTEPGRGYGLVGTPLSDGGLGRKKAELTQKRSKEVLAERFSKKVKSAAVSVVSINNPGDPLNSSYPIQIRHRDGPRLLANSRICRIGR